MGSNSKPKLFIFERREVRVLWTMGIVGTLFAFTLGVHLGKGSVKNIMEKKLAENELIETQHDKSPTSQEMNENLKNNPLAVNESLNQSLHEEVIKAGIKLKTPRQIELPQGAKTAAAGATTPQTHAEPAHAEEKHEAPAHAAPAHGKFALQVGSYPDSVEAKDFLKELETSGLQPFLKEVELKNKGKWYRVYVGAYQTQESAEAAGAEFKGKKLISSYIVSPIAE